MKYIKLFEKANKSKKKSDVDINFLMKEALNAIKDKMDELIGDKANWMLDDEKTYDDIFAFHLYLAGYSDNEKYIDENGIFYQTVDVDHTHFQIILQEQIKPLLENNGVFGDVHISAMNPLENRYYEFECEFGSMFKRGKNTGLLDQIV